MRRIRRLRRYGYDSEALEDALLSILGETTLGEAKTRLLHSELRRTPR